MAGETTGLGFVLHTSAGIIAGQDGLTLTKTRTLVDTTDKTGSNHGKVAHGVLRTTFSLQGGIPITANTPYSAFEAALDSGEDISLTVNYPDGTSATQDAAIGSHEKTGPVDGKYAFSASGEFQAALPTPS